MWPIDCTKDTIRNRGSTVNIWRIKLSASSIFRSVKTSCLCKIPSAKKNIFLLQKFSVFSFSSYIFFFSEYFPPFPSPIFLLHSSSRYQNVKMSKFQCPHSISRTCLAQEFGLVQLAALLSFARNMFFSFSLSLSPQVCLQLRLEIHSSGNIIGHGHACSCLWHLDISLKQCSNWT